MPSTSILVLVGIGIYLVLQTSAQQVNTTEIENNEMGMDKLLTNLTNNENEVQIFQTPVITNINSDIIESTTNQPPQFPNNIGFWSVIYPPYINTTIKSCILFKGALQLQFQDDILNKTFPVMQTIDVPTDAIATPTLNGSCSNTSQTLQLRWDTSYNNQTNQTKLFYNLDLIFLPTDDKLNYNVHEIKLLVSKTHFKDTTFDEAHTETETNNMTIDLKGNFMQTPFNRSFFCSSMQTIRGNLTVLTANLQFEAFRPLNIESDIFSLSDLCIADRKSFGTIVGIVVGVILAILVGISLGVYLGVRYGYCNFPCCKTGDGYQPLDH